MRMKLSALLLTIVIALGLASPLEAKKTKYKAPKSPKHATTYKAPKARKKPAKVKPMKFRKPKHSSGKARAIKTPKVRKVKTA